MSHAEVNGVTIAYEEAGEGEPLVLVHGSWSDRHDWEPLPGLISDLGRVVRYDRRGHGSSASPDGSPTRRDHEEDLAGLIEAVAGEPATVIGTSFGGSIALGLAARRPDLVSRVAVHEPPLVSWAPERPDVLRDLEGVADAIVAVTGLIATGEHEAAAARFADVVLGPGSWQLMPAEMRAAMIAEAPTFAAEQRDPLWAVLAPAAVAEIRCPVLFTVGSESPSWFRPISERLAAAIEGAQLESIPEAGHAPHATHPHSYRSRLAAFLARTTPVEIG